MSRWRPLAWFWLSVLVVAVAGGTVLRYLGPPPERLARDQMRSEPQRAAAPVDPEPSPATSPPANALPRTPEPSAPSPPQSQPAPDAQAPGTADQDVKPSSQPLIILHSASPGSGSAVAEQLASQLGLASDQITVSAAAKPVPKAIVRFYAAEDHPLARRLGNDLAQMGYAWRIDNLADHPSPAGHQPVEIWLPQR